MKALCDVKLNKNKMNIYSKMTPLDLQDRPVKKQEPVAKMAEFQYINKFKSAAYAFVLFILLSHKVAYKILDLIIKVFTNSVEVIDEMENPMMLGTLVMAVIMSLIIFIF